jgi:glycosyltransferase involved in cell wall biosynthesis
MTAIPLCRRLHAEVSFDVAHQLTFVSMRFPSALAWLGIPFVWGPVAGGEQCPASLYATFPWLDRVKERLRAASLTISRWDPLVRRTAARSSHVIAVTPDTEQALRGFAHVPTIEVAPAIGVQMPTGAPRQATSSTNGRARLLYVGRLLYWKGVHLALAAMPRTKDATLTVVGEGPFRSRLLELARHFRVEDRVQFTGNLPRPRVMELYGDHDIFLFPSLHDSGGMSVLEAMAAGLPVVCLDAGGPSLLVTNDTGIRVPVSSPKQTVVELAQAVNRLLEDPEHRLRLGRAGLARAATVFSWGEKGMVASRAYSQAISLAAERR